METTLPKTWVLTGATGFVGRALVLRLLRDGASIRVITRNPTRALDRLGPDVQAVPAGDDDAVVRSLADAEAIVHLAGETIAGRWTAARKRRILGSRVDGTRRLVELMRSAGTTAPLVSASAVGFYGDRDETVGAGDGPGAGFLADVCRAWEHEAAQARTLGVRVVHVRLGLVLGREGGALAPMLPAARLGLLGRLGSGEQPLPWIHLHDAVELLVAAASTPAVTGPVDGVTDSTTQGEFAGVLSEAVGRRRGPPVPGFVVGVALGEAKVLLMGGAPVRPGLAAAGVEPRYPTLRSALQQVVDPSLEPRIAPASTAPAGVPKRPAYVLEQRTRIDAPLEETFEFFSKAHNLALLTPTWTDFKVYAPPDLRTEAGTRITYRLKIGPVPLRWRTLIARWDPGRRFVDTQERGPYSLWWHEHEFEARDGGVDMVDRVHYTPPMGPLGRVANGLLVAPLLRRIFAWRAEAIALRFGTV